VTFSVETSTARLWSDEHLEALFAAGFPPFITADPEVKKYIGRVREYFTHLDLMLVDETGIPIATGWGVPIPWSDDVDELPSTFADILRRAVDAHESGAGALTFVICGGVVHPGHTGTGAAAELIRTLIDAARAHGMTRVLAPLRPTRKHQYPLVSIARYASWVRDDGLPFDPWLRLHARLGGRVIGLAPAAQTMRGTVVEWEDWTGMPLPETGDYIIPLGMSVLSIDVDADEGTYVEPNIWVRHR
jgi:GNAT superfamily N-acetyltransferase